MDGRLLVIAVISDVHGNLPALEAVLAQVESRGIARIWCLGDTLGYGPYVNECLTTVVQRCEIVLAGNHDLGVRGDIPAKTFGGSAGTGIDYACQHLEPEGHALLAGLAPSRILGEVELYHASANDPVWEYVREANSALRHLSTQRSPLSLVGHSHLQLMFHLNAESDEVDGGQVQAGISIALDEGARTVINPGSVGQPRDRDPRAAYAILTPGNVEFVRVPYDIARMRAAVEAAGLPAEIGDRLELGW